VGKSLPVGQPLGYLGIKESNPPNLHIIPRSPTSQDHRSFDIGDIWINEVNDTAYLLVNKNGPIATWIQFGQASNIFDSIAADSGFANPDINGVITITAENGLETIGTLNTLTLQFTPVVGYTGSKREFAQSAIQTVNNSPTNIISIPLSEGEMISIEARINAFRSTYNEAYMSTVFTGARRAVGGNITVINSIINQLYDSAGNPVVTVSADIPNQKIVIKFAGETAKTYNVVSTYDYHKTLTNA
jgi:hypothetical protein